MSAVPRLAGRVPGLYLIETDPSGERRFFYWRDAAPARQLFELEASQGLVERMAMARIVYFSGITLSLYSQPGLDRFEEALVRARAAGARIAFDGNFRPRGWGGDHHRARAVMSRFLRQVEIALPTFEDEAALWGDASPEATIARLQAEGVSEIVIKNGPSGAIIACGNQTDRVAVPQQVEAVDTTAAGDSFNAGYFAGRLAGQEPAEAAMLGHRLAAIVIRHRGAIVPRASTSGLLPVN
jgi:2-dehydro-3-deoxygluconokinase